MSNVTYHFVRHSVTSFETHHATSARSLYSLRIGVRRTSVLPSQWSGRRGLLLFRSPHSVANRRAVWLASCTPRIQNTKYHPIRFTRHARRPLPYIYAPKEILQLMEAASRLRESYPLRRHVYATMLGLIAATGLRISEALDLRLSDVLPDGILQIRRTKFGKSRLIPLHPTATNAIACYLQGRRQLAVMDDHVFLSAGSQRIAASTVGYTFRRIRQLAGIARSRTRPPRIHDMRHTFATRALEQCSTRREAVARHFVALATYMGHTDIAHTYWYLEATPELMTDIAAVAEALIVKESI